MAVGKGNANFCRKKYVSETGNGVILRGWMTLLNLGRMYMRFYGVVYQQNDVGQ